jgi:hypothetical protein
MVLELLQTNQLSFAADEWVNLSDDAAAREFLETLDAYLERPEEWLQTCARQLLRPEHASSERFVGRILALLDEARPGEILVRELRRLGDELIELTRIPKAESRAEVLRQLEKVKPHLEALDTDTIAPVGLIQVELPRVVEQLSGMTSVGTEPRLTVSPAVRTLFPVDRSEEVEIPVLIRNHEDASPARDVTITLQAPDGVGDWQPAIERDTQHLGTLGPGVSAYARFSLDLKPDIADHYTEWQLPLITRTGDRVQRTHFRITLRPESRQSTANPYTTGRAVRGEHFVGRTREIEAVVGAVSGQGASNPVLVYGIRRIGKTSILLKTQDHPEVARRFYVVYLSAEDRPDSDTSSEFLSVLCDKIRHSLPAEIQTQIRYQRRDFDDDPFHAFEVFMTGFHAAAPKKRLLLLLDEIDRFFGLIDESRRRSQQCGRALRPNEAFLPEILGALRKAIMEHDGLNVVFAGLPASFKRLQYQERFHGLLKLVEVRQFTEQDADDVVSAGKLVFTLTPDARDRLLDASGYQPYLLQVLCNQIFARMKSEGRDIATLPDVDSVIREKILPAEAYFSDYMSLVTSEGRPVLRALAGAVRGLRTRRYASLLEVTEKLRADGHPLDETTTQAILDSFTALGGEGGTDRPLVVRNPSNTRQYRPVIGLLGEFLLRGGN